MSETALASLPDPIERADRTGVVRLLYVGRLVRTKGARDVIRALALVDPSLPVALDIVGDGPDRATCEQLVTELGLSDRVHLHGWRSKLEVANFYRAADIFVFPSFREAGGNVAPEAMSYSLPLIVANRGGPGAATTDECAIRIDVSSPDKLVRDIAQAITSLATDRDRRLKMGAEAYKHVQRTALWQAKLDAIDAVYDRAIFSSANRYWGSRQPCRY
jgi:glycosyltransferase involved in cell wall biosynthesis